MDRLISEKQVLDAVDKVCRGSVEYRVIYDRCEELIKAIPSAEPSGDLISRQAVIKAIDEKAKRIKNADTLNGLAGAVGILFDLPSVKPQEPKYCDRNICLKNEYNGIGCNECEVTKSQEPTCDTCEYSTAAFNPCNVCKDKSEYKPQERSVKE